MHKYFSVYSFFKQPYIRFDSDNLNRTLDTRKLLKTTYIGQKQIDQSRNYKAHASEAIFYRKLHEK